MNIRNFLSNMFSSSKKNRIDDLHVQQQQQHSSRKSQDDHFVTLSSNVRTSKQNNSSNPEEQNKQQQQQQPEEDLLSNLRKSKLFFDDMDIPKSPPKQSMNQEVVSLAPISESSSNHNINNNNNSISQNTGSVQVKRSGLVPVSIDSIHLTTPSKLERQELQSFNQQRPNFSEFLNSLKKAKKMSAEKPVQQSPAAAQTTSNSIFFDKRNQQQQQGSANASDEPMITSLGVAGRSSVRSFIEEAVQQQDNQDVSVSDVLGRIPSGRVSGFANPTQESIQQQSHNNTHTIYGTSPMLSAQITGQILNSTTPSTNGNAQNIGIPSNIFNRSSSQSSSTSSRVRGSSSKKKAMFPESPITNNGANSMIGQNNSMIKRADAMMIAEIPLTNVFGSTTITTQQNVPLQSSSQVQGSIVSVNSGYALAGTNESVLVNSSRFQAPGMLVKEDVDGENEVLKAENGGEMEELIGIDGDDDCQSVEGGGEFNSSRKYQQECMSTRAEPPTQMKNRLNSFYFDETPAKQQQMSFVVITNGVSVKQMQRSSSASNNSSKSMNIESPDRASYMTGIEGNHNNNMNSLLEGVSSFSGNPTAAGITKEIHSNKCLSEYKSRSSGSSPSRSSLNSFHKPLELIVDKSEIPPNGFMLKSAQKIPSPIKEVEEISQRNPIHQTRKYSREMEVLEEGNSNNNNDRVIKEVAAESPKMRQKSVKFDYVEQTPQNMSSSCTASENISNNNDEDGAIEGKNAQSGRGDSGSQNNNNSLHHHHHSRVHDKLQSRKPTPYNPFKQAPGSYLSRQNKSANVEGEEADDDDDDNNNPGLLSPIENSRTVLFRDDKEGGDNNNSKRGSLNQVKSLGNQQQESPNHEQNSSLHLRNNVFQQQSAPQQQKVMRHEDSNSLSSRTIATTNKKPVKFPLALKKSDFAEQMKAASASVAAAAGSTAVGNKKVVGSHSNGFVRSEAISGARNNVTGTIKKEGGKAVIVKEQILSNGKVLTNKKKATGEHSTAVLSEMVGVARIAQDSLGSSEAGVGGLASNPLPIKMMLQSTPISGGTAVKSAYKNCVFCQNEVRLKDEFKILPCGHKSHIGCQPKEKILRCPRCNSNNLSNKYRPKE